MLPESYANKFRAYLYNRFDPKINEEIKSLMINSVPPFAPSVDSKTPTDE